MLEPVYPVGFKIVYQEYDRADEPCDRVREIYHPDVREEAEQRGDIEPDAGGKADFANGEFCTGEKHRREETVVIIRAVCRIVGIHHPEIDVQVNASERFRCDSPIKGIKPLHERQQPDDVIAERILREFRAKVEIIVE